MGLALLLSTTGGITDAAARAYDDAVVGASSPPPSSFSSSDYASETVDNVVGRLGDMGGNVAGTYGILEDISRIISEGKGVGGTLTYGAFRPSVFFF